MIPPNGDYVKLPYIDSELKQEVALGRSPQITKGFLYKRHYSFTPRL
jgi:hypothetical protein